MQVKRFLAADMRRALEMVRQELGPDAVILSSNRTKDGVELLTTRATADVPEPAPERAHGPSQSVGFAGQLAAQEEAPAETGVERAAAIERARERRFAQQQLEDSAREFLQPNQRVNAGIPLGSKASARPGSAAERYPLHDSQTSFDRSSGYQQTSANQASSKQFNANQSGLKQSSTNHVDRLAAAASNEARSQSPQVQEPQRQERHELHELQAEMAEMRMLLEEQLSQVLAGRETPRPPTLASVGRRLSRMGLPKPAMDAVLEGVSENRQLAQGWSDALARLSRQVPIDSSDVVDQGGTFALVGPTGAGKTTTIGKLAARYVMAHGAREVALVTLDTHRIGGHDQLRSLARILGVTLRVVDSSQSLDEVLYSLRRCSLVLIDTAGFRQGDPHLSQQMETLALQSSVKKLLVLPCNSQEAMLKASVHAYGSGGLAGCILTKLDESASLGEALGVVMQSGVAIVYTTHGQDIPRDLEVARGHKLVAKAAAMINRNESSRRVTAPHSAQSDIRAV